MQYFNWRTVTLFICGVVHLLPVTGVFGRDALLSLYGAPIDSDALLLLMQHRAILFGIIGAVLLVSIVRKHLQNAALLIVTVSMMSFVVLMLLNAEQSPPLQRVMWVDLVLLVGIAIDAVINKKASKTLAFHNDEK